MSGGIFTANGLEFKPTRKKQYDVYVCRPRPGTRVVNRLEGSQYITDQNKQFVISGTVGETWVIDINKLVKTYESMNGMPIIEAELRKRMNPNGIIDWMHLKTKPGGGDLNFAAHLSIRKARNFPVQTSWGDVLYANRDGISYASGDFLVCSSINGQPNLADTWVVNGEVFSTTYDMRGFANLQSSKKRAITPYPKPIINSGLSNK